MNTNTNTNTPADPSVPPAPAAKPAFTITRGGDPKFGFRVAHIPIEVQFDRLETFTDEYILLAWCAAQANPAPYDDRDAGEVCDAIGREIIRRWLSKQTPPLHHHQLANYYHSLVLKCGDWRNGEWAPFDKPEDKK